MQVFNYINLFNYLNRVIQFWYYTYVCQEFQQNTFVCKHTLSCSNSIISTHIKPTTTTITGHMQPYSQAHLVLQWSPVTHTQSIQLIITQYWLKSSFSWTIICMFFSLACACSINHLNLLLPYACLALDYSFINNAFQVAHTIYMPFPIDLRSFHDTYQVQSGQCINNTFQNRIEYIPYKRVC